MIEYYGIKGNNTYIPTNSKELESHKYGAGAGAFN